MYLPNRIYIGTRGRGRKKYGNDIAYKDMGKHDKCSSVTITKLYFIHELPICVVNNGLSQISGLAVYHP